ncbi:hypothetical protein AAFF_G00341400 [Aldrovandia affinis]|uniref:Granulocyte colony-stimulating factor n=1 Tax=Aldrovandia affinis TaxID=143900 RepID=A0AAD7WPC7_9TELE|nr:hypothetical protein AAFF_G00341400 [Aldrovandia affinis]
MLVTWGFVLLETPPPNLSLCALVLLVRAAPLPEYSGSLTENPEFHKAVKESNNLINKILHEIPAVHKSCVNSEALTLDPSGGQNLMYIVTSLGIPSAPELMGLSNEFTMEMCLNRMSEGLQLYQDLLSTVRDHVSTPEKVTDLRAAVTDLLEKVLQMRELAQLENGVQYEGTDLAARLTGPYEVMVATNVTLTELRSFTEHVSRSLGNIVRAKPALHGRARAQPHPHSI